METIKTHTFNGVRYDIDFTGPIDGSCDYPGGGKPSIRICVTDLDTQRGVETVIHECLHACCWSKTEVLTEQSARDIARLLRRIFEMKVNINIDSRTEK